MSTINDDETYTGLNDHDREIHRQIWEDLVSRRHLVFFRRRGPFTFVILPENCLIGQFDAFKRRFVSKVKINRDESYLDSVKLTSIAKIVCRELGLELIKAKKMIQEQPGGAIVYFEYTVDY